MSLESVGSLQRVKVGTLPVPSEVSAPFGARHVVFWHVDDQRVQVRPFHEVGRVDRIEEGTWTGAMYPTRDDAVQGGCPTKDVKSGPGREVTSFPCFWDTPLYGTPLTYRSIFISEAV